MQDRPSRVRRRRKRSWMGGAELRAARLRRGWAQADLAAYLDVTVNAVRNWETGRAPVPRPVALAVAAAPEEPDGHPT